MKKSLACIVSCLSLLTSTPDVYATSEAGSIELNSGEVFVAWTTVNDIDNLWHVMAGTGSVGTDPTGWSHVDVSVGGNGTYGTSAPQLYVDDNGNAVSIWQYYDSTANNYLLGAAVYSHFTSTWTSQLISDITTEDAGFGNQYTSFDDMGNIIVTWTAYSSVEDSTAVRCAIGSISAIDGSVTWNNSFILPNGDYAMAAKQQNANLKQARPQQYKNRLALAKKRAQNKPAAP